MKLDRLPPEQRWHVVEGKPKPFASCMNIGCPRIAVAVVKRADRKRRTVCEACRAYLCGESGPSLTRSLSGR